MAEAHIQKCNAKPKYNNENHSKQQYKIGKLPIVFWANIDDSLGEMTRIFQIL